MSLTGGQVAPVLITVGEIACGAAAYRGAVEREGEHSRGTDEDRGKHNRHGDGQDGGHGGGNRAPARPLCWSFRCYMYGEPRIVACHRHRKAYAGELIASKASAGCSLRHPQQKDATANHDHE